MGTSEQPQNQSTDDAVDPSNASSALSFILNAVIPGFAVLTVVLIFVIWYKSGCSGSARQTRENEDEEDEPLPDVPKFLTSSAKAEDHAPPPYEATRSHSEPATERWGDDRTICDEGDDRHSQHREASIQPAASSLPSSSNTNCLDSKADSSIRIIPAD